MSFSFWLLRLAVTEGGEAAPSFGGRYAECALDFETIVVVKAVHFDKRSRRVRTAGPHFLRDLVHNRTIAVHIGHVDDDMRPVLQHRPLVAPWVPAMCRMPASGS